MAKKPAPPKLKAVAKPDSNIVRMPNVFDPEQVNQRLYKQVSVLLRQLEDDDPDEGNITIRERIAGLIAIGRIQQLFITMRKATGDVGAGSTVKKFAAAFTAPDAVGGGAKAAGRYNPEPDDWFDNAERANSEDDDGDDAA